LFEIIHIIRACQQAGIESLSASLSAIALAKAEAAGESAGETEAATADKHK